MTIEEIKKEIENNNFEWFRKRMPDFPVGEVSKDERPDFLVKTNNGIIGIDITELIIQENQRKLEAMSEKIINLAQKYYKLKKWPDIEVKFNFNKSITNLPKKDYDKIARRIAELVHSEVSKNLTTPWNWCSLIPYELPETPEKISELINCISMICSGENHWSITHVGFAKLDPIKNIQKCIDKKHTKLKEYLTKCSTCWLLIVADSKPSSFIVPNEESLNNVYTSNFERTYLSNYPNQPSLLNTQKNVKFTDNEHENLNNSKK